jgi:hypothetical protein
MKVAAYNGAEMTRQEASAKGSEYERFSMTLSRLEDREYKLYFEMTSTRIDVEAPQVLDRLLERIRTRTARVGIIGLGYVGLPL